MEYKDILKSVRNKIDINPELGIILGSGLNNYAENIENQKSLKYSDIEGFVDSTVKGHSGEYIYGELNGKKVICMKGRIHYYEGHPIGRVVLPLRIMLDLGIKTLIVTNACGGVNLEYRPGDLMIIKDHINFTGVNPLIGPNDDTLGPRFPDMTYTYDRELINIAKRCAKESNMDIKEGVYMWFTGPVYETPAEVKMARILGADAVGMSTVPEVILAHHRGVRVLGISCITNMAAGILDKPLAHEDVVEVSNIVKDKFANLVSSIVRSI